MYLIELFQGEDPEDASLNPYSNGTMYLIYTPRNDTLI